LVHQKVENAKHQILAQAAVFARVLVRMGLAEEYSLGGFAQAVAGRDLLGAFCSQRR
jgi:hypothetical protein